MADILDGDGFLETVGPLTPEQTEQACEAALANARDLLSEADLLREAGRCARAYFLAHIACEELGKLPILCRAAVAHHLGRSVNWHRIDRLLRDHRRKFAEVLFMDSIVGGGSIQEGQADYDADLRRMRMYQDAKNASLYSFRVDGEVHAPQATLPCTLFDSLRDLAHSRADAFQAMYLAPIRTAGGMDQFLAAMTPERVTHIWDTVTGDEARAAFETYTATGDDAPVRDLIERMLERLVDTPPPPD